MKNPTGNFILIIIFLVIAVNLIDAQNPAPAYRSPSEVWEDWKKEKCKFRVHSIYKPEERKKVDLLIYYLINAYHEFCKGNLDNSYDFIEKISDELPGLRGKARDDLLINKGYLVEHSNLIEKLSQRYLEEGNRVIDEKKKERNENYVDEIEKRFRKQEKLAQRNIPADVPSCMDSHFEYELTDKNGIQFNLTTIFCDRGDFEKDSYALGQIGLESYFSALAEWFFNQLVVDWCDEKDMNSCLDNINISIEGHTDSHPVRGTIGYGENAFKIMEGLTYSFRSPSIMENGKRLNKTLENQIDSNEELGLVRAMIAHGPFSEVTNNPIEIASIEHSSPGETFRKVVITISAANLFNRKLTDFEDEIMKSIKLKQKRLSSFLIRP
ncbi:MAG: hypothetical protein J5I98_30720 [Phaeodactylibacter sp.]|nr:hypothetical protein [Phaeodactylibacter sp.]